LETLKTRLITAHTNQYTGVYNCAYNIYQQGGWRGFYRGLTPSLLGVVPYVGINLTMYETLKTLYISYFESRNARRPPSIVLLLCGAMASATGQLVVYPTSLARTILQAQGAKGHPVIYKGPVDCFRKILATEGVKGLYKGLAANYMKTLPAVGISFVVYEKAQHYLHL